MVLRMLGLDGLLALMRYIDPPPPRGARGQGAGPSANDNVGRAAFRRAAP